MVILTNDPSLTAWGWAVVQLFHGKVRILKTGCVKTAPAPKKRKIYKADDRARRITEISKELNKIHKEYSLDWIISESPHGAQNYNAAVMIGMVPGILCTFGTDHNLPVEWYSEGDAKKHLSGKRSLSKQDTIKHIVKIYGKDWVQDVKYKDEAVADSLAVFHVARAKSQALIYALNIK